MKIVLISNQRNFLLFTNYFLTYEVLKEKPPTTKTKTKVKEKTILKE